MKRKSIEIEKEYNGTKYLLEASKDMFFDHLVMVKIYVYNPKALLFKWNYVEESCFSLKDVVKAESGIEIVFSRYLEKEEYKEKSKEKWNNFCNKY